MREIIISGIAILLFSTFCSFKTQTSSIRAEEQRKHIVISRLDKALFEYINTPSQSLTKRLADNYPHTLAALSQTINSSNSKSNIFDNLQVYFSHPALNNIYKDVLNKFDNLDSYENALTTMSSVAEKELKTITPPKFSAHVSGFKENTIYVNNTISLSLDKYMGSNYIGYKGYYKGYQLQQMEPKMIVRDFTKAWLMADFIKTETTNGDMLLEMIEHGKLLYALSVLLPQYTEHDLIGYNDLEYNWCVNNHKRLWNSIVKQNHLYTTDRHVIYTYFDEAPNNKGMIKGAPGQIGSWIGLQIVKQYAKQNKQNLSTIINTDYRIILKESKYKR